MGKPGPIHDCITYWNEDGLGWVRCEYINSYYKMMKMHYAYIEIGLLRMAPTLLFKLYKNYKTKLRKLIYAKSILPLLHYKIKIIIFFQ